MFEVPAEGSSMGFEGCWYYVESGYGQELLQE
jgi:hypothetical protein